MYSLKVRKFATCERKHIIQKCNPPKKHAYRTKYIHNNLLDSLLKAELLLHRKNSCHVELKEIYKVVDICGLQIKEFTTHTICRACGHAYLSLQTNQFEMGGNVKENMLKEESVCS